MEHYLENLAPLASYAIAVLFRTVVCVSVCVCYVCARYNKYVSIDGIYPMISTLLLYSTRDEYGSTNASIKTEIASSKYRYTETVSCVCVYISGSQEVIIVCVRMCLSEIVRCHLGISFSVVHTYSFMLSIPWPAEWPGRAPPTRRGSHQQSSTRESPARKEEDH